MSALSGKNILVTGGTGILGREFVRAISAAHGTAIVLGRNQSKATELLVEIKEAGGFAFFLKADVEDIDSLILARRNLEKDGFILHGLVNAAGGNVPEGIVPPDRDVFDIDLEGVQKAMNLNTMGTINAVQVFGKMLTGREGGSIVNISSVSAQRPLTRVLGYGMGKAALDNYTKWMAVEIAKRYGDRIRINAIAPGFFLSKQNEKLLIDEKGNWTSRAESILQHTPFQRFGKASELTAALIWLLSDQSSFVTGMNIGIDGGFTINSGV
ncbi:MAG: SDR family oxidoreductase [Saprospiraceae bacterium]|jgi:NAD(P)-dependent dehydrogenase (short-subunit alcohol dehydrogenase family)